MSDIVSDAKRWLDVRNGRVSKHSENCHQWHAECLVALLVAEVERHKMTEEERGAMERARDFLQLSTIDLARHTAGALRNYLDRTAPKEVGRE